MSIAADVVSVLQQIPAMNGSCAGSPIGVDNEILPYGTRTEDVVAIGKLIGADGLLHGWIYRTAKNHLFIQRVTPPLPSDFTGRATGTTSALTRFDAPHGDTLIACTSRDYRSARSLKF